MTAARKLAVEPSPPEEAPRRSRMYDLIMQEMEGADVAGFVEAANRYGDDHARALADLQAGRHPLQDRKRAR